jgi:hypothetical protein
LCKVAFAYPEMCDAFVGPGVQTHPELQNRISYLFPASFLPSNFLSLVEVMSHYVVPIFRMEISSVRSCATGQSVLGAQ